MNLNSLRNLDTENVLSTVGLQARASVGATLAGSIATFGVGMLVGAGLGLLLAPKSGPALREDIRQRLRRAPEDLRDAVASVKAKTDVASVRSTSVDDRY